MAAAFQDKDRAMEVEVAMVAAKIAGGEVAA